MGSFNLKSYHVHDYFTDEILIYDIAKETYTKITFVTMQQSLTNTHEGFNLIIDINILSNSKYS